MAKRSQQTFLKRQREQKKAEKAAQKRAKRAAPKEETPELNPELMEGEVPDGEDSPPVEDDDAAASE